MYSNCPCQLRCAAVMAQSGLAERKRESDSRVSPAPCYGGAADVKMPVGSKLPTSQPHLMTFRRGRLKLLSLPKSSAGWL